MQIGNLKLASTELQYQKYQNLRKEDVAYLMEWVKQQPHFPQLTELEIILFLHACMYSQEFTKTVLDAYLTCKTHVPEIFSNRIPDKSLQVHMNVCLMQVLPDLTPDGTRVIYVRLLDTNASHLNFLEQVKIFTMITDIDLLRTGLSDGHAILFDMEGLTLSHLARCSIMGIKKFMYYVQECIPAIRRGIHFVNVIPWMDKFLAVVKPFLKEELLELIYIHNKGIDNVYKYIPKKMLPEVLGGDGPSIKEMHDNMKKDIIEHADFFKEEQATRRVNESLRPGKAISASDIFGVEGSFKKLDID